VVPHCPEKKIGTLLQRVENTMSTAPQTRKPHLSKRMLQLQPSATIGLISRIAEMKAEGISVISFGQGEPDFPTPEPIKTAATEALRKNYTFYTPTGGFAELRQAVADRFTQDTGIAYALNQVTVTCGAKEALYLALQALCDEGDEVIIPAPYWVSYIEQARLAGATPVIVPTEEANHFKMTGEQLAQHLTPRTRAVMLNSPCNPTGAVYHAEELRSLADALRGSEALVISDEIYDQICFVDYARWLRVAPECADRTIVINGASKTYSMTGWRVGYAAGPAPVIAAMRIIQSHSTTHPASMAQHAAWTMLSASVESSTEISMRVAEMVFAFRERQEMIVNALNTIEGVRCIPPEGAFYVFPNVSGLLNRPLGSSGTTCASSQELASYLLEQAHVGVVFGEAFGAPGYLRLSFSQSSKTIEEGMRRFTEAVQ
jgi:aspartate aminotransferase